MATHLNVTDIVQKIAIMANEGLPVDVTSLNMLELIGRHAGWLLGRVIYRPDMSSEDQSTIVWRNPDSLPLISSAFDWDARPVHNLMIEGRPVVVPDIQTDPALRQHFARLPSEYRGYVAYPIMPETQLAGAIEFFFADSLQLTPEVQELLGYGAAILGLIIERAQAQSQLRKSERRFRAVFDQSYQFISLMEPDGTLIAVNDTALNFSGLTADDLIGQKYWNRAWWHFKGKGKDRLKSLLATAAAGQAVRFEAEVQSPAGQVIAVDFSVKPILNRQGQVVQLISEGRDITELRRTLQHLRLAETRLEEAQHIAQIGHWDYDLTSRQTTWSKTLLEIFKLDPTQVNGFDVLLAHVHPEDVERVSEAIDHSIRTGKSYEHQFRIVRSDGTVLTVYGAGGPVVNESGKRVRITGIIQDITRRRQLEQSLAYSVERLSTLNTMGQSVVSTLDLDLIYQDVLSAGRALLKADAVILFSHEGDELYISAVEQEGNMDLLGQRLPDSVGVAGEAWTTGQAVWLSGDECHRRRADQLARNAHFDPLSLIAVPVHWQNQVLGVLEAADSKEDAFTADDVRLLQAIATWTAIAIGNTRQHHSLERRLQESEAIALVSRSLSGTLEPQSILELIVHTAHDIVPRSDWAIIHLLQGRPERLVPTVWAGIDQDLADYIIAPDEGAAGLALIESKLVNIADTQTDPRPSSYAHMIGLRSLLVAPVQTRNLQLGTITLHCRQPGAFTEEDERLLTILAAQAGLAIENAHLFDSQRRARLVAELQRKRLRILTERLVSAQEEERLRISRELHDEAGQALTSLKISLDLLRNRLFPEHEALRSRLSDLSNLTGETMENLRALAHDLRPPGLDAFGLNVALEGLCHDFANRTGLLIDYAGDELPEISTTLALSLYRFAQEALTNIAKHAEARTVEVRLVRENGSLSLSIADDGRGFTYEPDAGQGGVGLVSMQERTDLLGGVLDVDTAPGQGTRLTARVPFEIPTNESNTNESTE